MDMLFFTGPDNVITTGDNPFPEFNSVILNQIHNQEL
jgi:hypothetical protein